MVDVVLRDGNKIMNLNVDMKAPIRSQSRSLIFHSPMDLLTCAAGSCIGNEIIQVCLQRSESFSQFEEIQVIIKELRVEAHITYAADTDSELIQAVHEELMNCPVSNMLKYGISITMTKSKVKKDELRSRDESKGCCGS